ncbi:sensor histidine kinase [Microcella flavibacter]|uniref:sensor histidine kinase n=1 Tax=Microcella flavibacter TaxID=1804990 RepID=UPI00145665B8|nr:ATP-binding protein [Microcella flavibacter]
MTPPEAAPAALRAPLGAKLPRQPLSRKRVDTVLSRSVSGFGVVFALQALLTIPAQFGLSEPLWSTLAVAAVFGSILLAMICSIVKRFVVGSHRVVAVVYVIALITWPFFVIEPQTGNHWLYQLTTVATACAAVGLRVRGASLYLFIVPFIYGTIRATPNGGGGPWEIGLFDAVFAVILGGAVLVIVTMTRVAATSVDEAQGNALERYAHAVRQHATEVERVEVDAIVHDSVLTTFISAARAASPAERALAATMATNAMRHLEEAAQATPDDGSTVRFRQVAERIVTAARELSVPISIRVRSLDTRIIPAAQAEALYSAAVQSMVNSVQHAGGPDVRRWLRVSGVQGGAIEIEIGDAGAGFDPALVPGERLGVRRSIIERMASAGGLADVRSAPGRGTVVHLHWPVMAAVAPTLEPGAGGERR